MSNENGENRGGELPDEQADALLDQLAARADERDDIDLRPGSKRTISRRSLLGAVGAAGAGALALGSGNAEAQTGQWGNATGSAGTESKPFNEAWVQDLYSQTGEFENEVLLKDTSTTPSTNGEFRQNDSDVEVYSGGSVRNLSDIGGGSDGVDVEEDGSTVVSGVSAINFGTELDASDDGDGSATVTTTGDVVTDGDGTDREIWVISNGASDPAGADAEDIIFEEES